MDLAPGKADNRNLATAQTGGGVSAKVSAMGSTPQTLSQKARVIQPPKRGRGTQILALFTIVIPTILGIIYYGFIASDIYVVEATMTVSSSNQASPMPDIPDFFKSGSQANDTNIVYSYIHSRDMLMALQETLDLRSMYSRPEIDLLARLEEDTTTEGFLDYYRDNIAEVYLNESSNLLTVTVHAFKPEDAKRITEVIILEAEKVVNRISDKARANAMKNAQEEMTIARQRLSDAQEAATRFRAENPTITYDPSELAKQIFTLENEQTGAEAELEALRAMFQPNAIEIIKQEAKIKALESQLATKRKQLGTQRTIGRKDIFAQWARLQLNEKLAQEQYTMATAGLEAARGEAARQQRYLVAFEQPYLPDEAIEPDREIMILTVFMSSIVLFGIIVLVIASIREHARI